MYILVYLFMNLFCVLLCVGGEIDGQTQNSKSEKIARYGN